MVFMLDDIETLKLLPVRHSSNNYNQQYHTYMFIRQSRASRDMYNMNNMIKLKRINTYMMKENIVMEAVARGKYTVIFLSFS